MAPKSSSLYVIQEPKPDVETPVENTLATGKEHSFEDALNIIGYGRVQVILLLVSGIILMAVMNETMGMMIIGIASECDLDLTSWKKGLLGAVAFIGILMSSHLWGYIADTFGRRKLIMYTIFASNFFTLISCFLSNFWLFIVARFFSGIFISGPSATIYAYLGEFNTVKYRPISIAIASIFIGVSTIYIPVLGWLILPQVWSIPLYESMNLHSWRLLLILYAVPGFIGALCLLKLPESPKFLLSQRKEMEALEVVQWIYEKNSRKPKEDFEVKILKSEIDKTYMENLQSQKKCLDVLQSMWQQTIPLFKPPYVINFLICCVIMFGIFFCSNGLGLWFPEILNRLNTRKGDIQQTVCDVVQTAAGRELLIWDALNDNENGIAFNSTGIKVECDGTVDNEVFTDSLILGILNTTAYCLLAAIVKPVGRKVILSGALLGSGICGLSLHWIVEPFGIAILFAVFLVLSGVCISVVNGTVVDLIPTHLRGMAVCICLMIGRSGGVFGSNIVGGLLEVNCAAVFFIFSGFTILCGMLSFALPSD